MFSDDEVVLPYPDLSVHLKSVEKDVTLQDNAVTRSQDEEHIDSHVPENPSQCTGN